MFKDIFEKIEKIKENVTSKDYCDNPRYVETDFQELIHLVQETQEMVTASKGGKDGIHKPKHQTNL